MAEYKNTYLIYRGTPTAMVSRGSTLLFATRHDEGHPMGLYALDVDKGAPKKAELPGGALALVRDAKRVYVACDDGHVYRGDLGAGKLTTKGAAFDRAPTALALLAGEKLAVAVGSKVEVVSREDGEGAQTLDVGERVTAVAADPSGEWLVTGTDRGTLVVWDGEGGKGFTESARARVHEGEVRALLFEAEELRVLSTGSDLRLLVTHVRGELEPEDRGGSGAHDKPMVQMIRGVEDRFYSVGLDSAVKAWPSGRTNKRPTTQREHVVKPTALTLVEHNDRPHIAIAGQDGTLRLFTLDDEGKVGECVQIYRDAFAWAAHEFESGDVKRREKALKKLTTFNDTRALKVLAERVNQERDHKLQVLAVKLLGTSGNARAVGHLEGMLGSSSQDVRLEALEGLRRLSGAGALRPLELALGTREADVGVKAVDALGELCGSDDMALELLIEALSHYKRDVRERAVNRLEDHYGKKSPETVLLAMRSSREDMRVHGLALANLRGFADDARVSAVVRRLMEDGAESVRLQAFLVSLCRRPTLVKALRGRDEVLNRKLFDLEGFGKKRKEDAEPPSVKLVPVSKLEVADYEPLLEAMSSRALSTCVRGALGLAGLQDPRAFGTLLQLSRDPSDEVRVDACRAFQRLGDPRSLKRLRMMLRDGAAGVRDAAFSALLELEGDRWLAAARAGLSAEHEDVHRRGLQALTAKLRKLKGEHPEGIELLARTLNDQFNEVRSEAFKSALSLKVGGGEESALRFGARSIHSDVRLDVLVEVMGSVTEDWAWGMVLEFYEDPDADLRKEAFEFALKKGKKKRRTQALSAALSASYADVRLMSVKELTERRLEDVAELLVQALDDEDERVRRKAVGALVTAGARTHLIEAMGSRHVDIQARAAKAVADLGDATALDTLMALAGAEAPDEERRKERKAWREAVVLALEGLEELGEPAALDLLGKLIEGEDKRLRKRAVRALVWCSRSDSLDVLRRVLRHADDEVKREAALGLAFYGDSAGASMVFGVSAVNTYDQLYAALGLIEQDEDRFFSFLDHRDETFRNAAFLLLLLRELSERDGVPDKCLAALSADQPAMRLAAADALAAFGGGDASFAEFVRARFNGFNPSALDWEVDASVIDAISAAVTYGGAQVRVRAARLLRALEQSDSGEFERQWAIYRSRYSESLDAMIAARDASAPSSPESGEEPGRLQRAWSFLKSVAKGVTGDESPGFQQALDELVFGAYVGLSRQQRDARVRLQAVERIHAAASQGARAEDAARSVLSLALGDSDAKVREAAFGYLQGLGVEAELLANEALSTGFNDTGALALKLLAERGDAKAGRALLQDAVLTKTDGLEFEAWRLLAEGIGELAAHAVGLGAASESMRKSSRSALMLEWGRDASADEALRGALTSRHDDVRRWVAAELAGRGEAASRPVLVEMIGEDDGSVQRWALSAARKLGDATLAEVMLDRVADDEGGTADAGAMIGAAASFRDASVAPRLERWLEDGTHRWESYRALVTIAGYDQRVEDYEDPVDAEWVGNQHPRDDARVASLLDVAYRIADQRMLKELIPMAMWSPSSVVDAALAPLAGFSQEGIRHAALSTIGWRARHRDGDKAPLRAALRGADPTAQFIAAEALALAGEKDGQSVLMTAVNFMDDYSMRERAVLALGVLADEGAIELLLELAHDEEGLLRQPAAEALGHMSASARADEVFKLLVGFARESGSLAQRALTGLRFFGTRAAWREVRRAAVESGWWIRQHAAELLGYSEGEEAIELLSKLAREEDDSDVANAAAASLRRIHGEDSLEPDYVLVTSRYSWLDEQDETVSRLRERGDAARILELLPRIHEDNEDAFFKPLVTALLARTPLPVDSVAGLMASGEDRTATVAAQIVGRGGNTKDHGEAARAGVEVAHAGWEEAVARSRAGRRGAAAALATATARYKMAVWVSGRLEVGASALAEAAAISGADGVRAVREEALLALCGAWSGEVGLKALDAAAVDADAKIRALAVAGLATRSSARADELLPAALEDATSFNRLVGAASDEVTTSVLRGAADRIHYQGVALPHLVARGDVEALIGVASDAKLEDETRLGAIESLSRSAGEGVLDALAAIGKSEQEDEELRKAAWRAFRRARRVTERAAEQGA